MEPQGLMWTSPSQVRCESFHCYNETPRANHGRVVPLRMIQARVNSLKQPGENQKGGNNIVQVNKYNTWASEGRWQAASHRALDKLAHKIKCCALRAPRGSARMKVSKIKLHRQTAMTPGQVHVKARRRREHGERRTVTRSGGRL